MLFRSRHSIFTTKTFFHQNFSSPQHQILFTLTMDAFLFWCFLAALLGWLAVEMMHDPLVPIRAPAPNPPAPSTTTTTHPLPPRAVRRALAHRPLAAKPFGFAPVSSGLATTLPSTWRAYPTLGTQMHRPRSNEDKIPAGRGASSAGAVHCAWSPASSVPSLQHQLAKPRRSAQEIWVGFDFTPTPLVSRRRQRPLLVRCRRRLSQTSSRRFVRCRLESRCFFLLAWLAPSRLRRLLPSPGSRSTSRPLSSPRSSPPLAAHASLAVVLRGLRGIVWRWSFCLDLFVLVWSGLVLVVCSGRFSFVSACIWRWSE
jgi:hypothetical protein